MDENIDNIAETFFFLLILCSFISDTHYVIKERNPKLDYLNDCIQALFIYSFTENKNERILIDNGSMENQEVKEVEKKEEVVQVEKKEEVVQVEKKEEVEKVEKVEKEKIKMKNDENISLKKIKKKKSELIKSNKKIKYKS